MNKVIAVCSGTALVAVLGFQQLEIAAVHDDVQDIKQFLIKTNDRIRYTSAEAECLAKNIYHEAGVEPTEGKYAVAQVTINRLKSGRWGKDICSVVYAKSQFSWTLYKKRRVEQPKGPLWEESKAVARSVLDRGVRVPSLSNSMLYHADYIKPPVWTRTRTVAKIQQVGQHIFYEKT
jgi:spore germination cell wall hydrolase CwlJ-like protein